MTRDHNPFRYVGWLTRDALMWPGRAFLIILALVTLIAWRFAQGMGIPPAVGAAGVPNSAAQFVQYSLWQSCLTVAVLMTVAGIPGTDLERGYYRSWFSKPMAPWWYYLQRYLLGALLLLLTPVLLGGGLELVLHTGMGLSWAMIGQIAIGYLLLASATLLVSLFIARGWLIVFLLDVVQSVLEGITRTGVAPKWLGWLHNALPPFHLMGAAQPLPHGGPLWQVLGYGGGMLIAALVLLRVRPLGAGTAA